MPSTTLTKAERDSIDSLVHTSIDDARSSLQCTYKAEADTPPSKLESNLRILRLALEEEKNGSNRVSLLNLLRSAIRANETALEAIDGDLVVAIPINKKPGEPIPARPVEESEEVEVSPEEQEPVDAEEEVDPSPMVHLRYAPKSAFAHHPRLADIPMPGRVLEFLESKQDAGRAADLAEELAAFRNGVFHAGIIEPLKVVPCPPLLWKTVAGEVDPVRWWIVDGRTRHEAAPENEEIPFVEIFPNEVDTVIEATVSGRRNWTKGQKAYLAVLRNRHFLESEVGNPQFKKPQLDTECPIAGAVPDEPETREDLAARFGVSMTLLKQAIELVRAMDSLREGYPKKVEDAEMQVWAGDGLASVLSGLKGFQSTVGKSKPGGAFALAARHLTAVAKSAKNFATWNQAEMMAFRDAVADFWEALPAEAGDFLTLVRVHDTRSIEALIAKREAAKEEGGAS